MELDRYIQMQKGHTTQTKIPERPIDTRGQIVKDQKKNSQASKASQNQK
jgi:hypothetical protein